MYWRKFQLKRLYSMVKDHEDKFYEALAMDMKKPRHEALMGEISPVLDECLYFLDVSRNMRSSLYFLLIWFYYLEYWKTCQRWDSESTLGRQSSWHLCYSQRSPGCSAHYRQVLKLINATLVPYRALLGAWNYPLQVSWSGSVKIGCQGFLKQIKLVLVPLAGAIAAGNAAIIKVRVYVLCNVSQKCRGNSRKVNSPPRFLSIHRLWLRNYSPSIWIPAATVLWMEGLKRRRPCFNTSLITYFTPVTIRLLRLSWRQQPSIWHPWLWSSEENRKWWHINNVTHMALTFIFLYFSLDPQSSLRMPR